MKVEDIKCLGDDMKFLRLWNVLSQSFSHLKAFTFLFKCNINYLKKEMEGQVSLLTILSTSFTFF